jgi:hypothetical protein
MPRRKRTSKTWKLPLSIADLERHAPAIFGGLLNTVSDGFTLQRSSGIWRKANGTGTARYVYRRGSASGNTSIVLTAHNIALVRTAG